jgi:ADP-heptose:LPS heptosyltransferase
MRKGTLILFPGALGDFICALPAFLGLRKTHGPRTTLVARSEALELLALPGLTPVSIDRSEIADLFATGAEVRSETRALLGEHAAVYSWTGAGDPDFASRLKSISAGPVKLLPFRGMRPGEHAVDYYARSAGVSDVLPVRSALRIDRPWFDEYAARNDLCGRKLLVLHIGSGSPAKNWAGYAELAARWLADVASEGRVIVLCGPLENDTLPRHWAIDGLVTLSGLSLPQAAAVLAAGGLYVGNDSGISHLAGAVGAQGVVLFGPTDPAVWAPRAETVTVLQARRQCGVCRRDIFCCHRLEVARVLAVLDRGARPLSR